MRWRAVAALLLTSVSVSACGDDEPKRRVPLASEPSSATATTSPADDGPVAAYTAWLDALQAHDPKAACARHAYDFSIALRYEAVLLDRAELGDPCVGFVAVLWEQPEREYDPVGVEVTQETREDALLAVDFPVADVTVEMQVRDGSWYVLDEATRNQELPAGSDPVRWLGAWCDLAVGMTVEQVTGLMGEPSGTYTIANGGEPQLYWAQDQYDFRAYLDGDPPDGVVIEAGLVGDYDRLTADERDGLACPELR